MLLNEDFSIPSNFLTFFRSFFTLITLATFPESPIKLRQGAYFRHFPINFGYIDDIENRQSELFLMFFAVCRFNLADFQDFMAKLIVYVPDNSDPY